MLMTFVKGTVSTAMTTIYGVRTDFSPSQVSGPGRVNTVQRTTFLCIITYRPGGLLPPNPAAPARQNCQTEPCCHPPSGVSKGKSAPGTLPPKQERWAMQL